MWFRLVIRKSICLCFLFLLIRLAAQETNVADRLEYVPYFATNYSPDFSMETGLPEGDLNTVVQDRSGLLFFGSWGNGIFKFDGHSWSQYAKENAGLNDDEIISMVYDDKDYIYIAHQSNGVTRFNVQTCRGELLIEGSEFSEKITKIMYVPGDLLYICCVGGGGIYRYNLATGVNEHLSLRNLQKGKLDWKWNALRGILQDSQGRIWVGSRLGVAILNDKTVESYFPYHDLRDQQIFQIFETEDRRILVLAEQFIGIVDEAAGEILEYNIPPFAEKIAHYKLCDDRSLLKDRLGNYILLSKGGAVVYDPRTGKSYELNETNKLLVHNLINSGFVDEENNIWLTTQEGVTQLNVNPFKNVKELDGITLSNFNTTDPEYHLLSSNLGGVWLYCKADDLLYRLNGELYTRIDLAPISALERKLRNVFISRGREYYQIAEDFYYYDASGDEFIKEDLYSIENTPEYTVKDTMVEKNNIRYSFYSRSKNNQGLMEFDPLSNRIDHHLLNGLNYRMDFLTTKIYFFDREKNKILVVNEADPELCYIYDTKQKTFSAFSPRPLLENSVGREVRIKQIKGSLDMNFWITSRIPEGLVFKLSAIALENMTTKLRTENITIEDIKIDDHNRLLLATATKGLFIFSDDEVKFFGSGEGLTSDRLVGGIAIGPRIGEIYLNSIDTFSIFDENLLVDRSLSVRFSEIRNSDIRLELAPVILTGSTADEVIELEPAFRSLDVQAVVNTYASKKNIYYRFKLEGKSSSWTPEKQANHILLYDLTPGETNILTVEVRDHLNRRGTARVEFRITPFWYEDALFIGAVIVLSIILLIGLGILLSVKRTRSLQQKATELEELVNLRTAKLNKTQSLLEDKVEELEKLAQTDTLTDLSNRRHIMKLLEDEFTRSQESHISFCIILGDIDHFKNINDQHGHECGDKVLREISSIFMTSIRKSDFASRWGGEEFLILLPGCTTGIGIDIAENIRQKVENLIVDYQEAEVSVTMSFGVAEFSFNADGTCDAVIKRADDNLYIAKDLGRNRVMC